MKSFLYDLYFGNLTPWERGCPQDPAYPLVTQKICDMEAHFEKLLSSQEYEKFKEMENLQAQAGAMEDIDLFEYGFCMDSLMMLDVCNFRDRKMTK